MSATDPDHSQAEIAEMVDATEAAVKQRAYRALEALEGKAHARPLPSGPPTRYAK